MCSLYIVLDSVFHTHNINQCMMTVMSLLNLQISYKVKRIQCSFLDNKQARMRTYTNKINSPLTNPSLPVRVFESTYAFN